LCLLSACLSSLRRCCISRPRSRPEGSCQTPRRASWTSRDVRSRASRVLFDAGLRASSSSQRLVPSRRPVSLLLFCARVSSGTRPCAAGQCCSTRGDTDGT
jgi:hypothetical protein